MGILKFFKGKAKEGGDNVDARQTSSAPTQSQASSAAQKAQTTAAVKDASPENNGIKLLYPLDAAQAAQANVDVIFLHGLTGHRDRTWTATGASEPWPKLFLPDELPFARIMTYGYDADVANWIAPAGQNTVREHAQNLINDVHRYRVRTSTTRKSILWVVHSLGGLVLQDALVVCNNPRDEGQREVLLCTKGIAFMGTPHAGSDFAKFAVAVSNIINLSMVKKTNNSILSVLQSHSEMLANIRDDFMTIVNARAAKAQPIQLHSFIEELVVASTGHRVVTPDSAKIVGYNSDTIHANHMDMTKFSSKNNSYNKIAGTLMEWANSMEIPDTDTGLGQPRGPIDYKFTEKELDCLQLFGPATYLEHKARNPDRVPGTCQWFLKHPNFRGWHEGVSSDAAQLFSGLLWVSGDPGCGKSVLSKSLSDIELKSSEGRTTCYFFFKDDDLGQKDATKAICALLHQLFTQRPALIKHAIPDFKANGQGLVQSFHMVWNILLRASADPDAGNVVCILDALDECEEIGRVRLIEALDRFYKKSTASRTPTLKFLVTSRPYVEIEREFQQLADKFPTIRLAGEEDLESIGKEINLVIEARVQILGSKLKLSDGVCTTLKEALISVKNRTYLWITLIFNVVSESLKVTQKSISTIVSTLPTTVDKAYEAILDRGHDPPRARKLLQIIVAAERPFTLREMNVALNLNKSCLSFEDIDLQPTEDNLKTEIRNLCGLFISILDSKIYLIHQTAKEFLIANSAEPPAPKKWKASFNPHESHFTIAEICMRYLVLLEPDCERMARPSSASGSSRSISISIADSLEFTKGPPREDILVSSVLSSTNLDDVHERDSSATTSLKSAVENDMLDYAARYWNVHLKNVTTQAQSLLLDMGLKLLNTKSPYDLFMKWFPLFWDGIHPYQSSPGFTDVIAVSYFGHEVVLHSIISRGDDLDACDKKGKTALSWAASLGHASVAQLLLQSGTSVDVLDQDGRTPLAIAVEFGHIAVAKYLLLHKANPNIIDREGFSILSVAANSTQVEAVELLLENGVDMELPTSDGRSSLSIAVAPPLLSWKSDLDNSPRMIEASIALLEKGALVNSRDSLGRTPLTHATCNGYGQIVELLLKYGAIIDPEDNKGRTPLALLPTQITGRLENDIKRIRVVILILLKAGADINHKDESGRTPLAICASTVSDVTNKLQEGLIGILLEQGADVESRDIHGQTPLMIAAIHYGSEEKLRMLLASGANIDAQDDRGWTAIMWAAQAMIKGAVEVLIEKGANVNTKAKDGTTLLHIAVVKCDALVKNIINLGADLNSKTDAGCTPLSLLTKRWHSSTRALLLQYSAIE